MIDYTISPVGRASGSKPLVDVFGGDDLPRVRFEEIGSRESWPRDSMDSPGDPGIRIIQAPSSADEQLKTQKSHWNEIASRTVNRLDAYQRGWRNVMKVPNGLNASSNADLTAKEGIHAIRSGLRQMLNFSYHLVDSQVRMAVVNSIASTIKTSLSTLYKQQG